MRRQLSDDEFDFEAQHRIALRTNKVWLLLFILEQLIAVVLAFYFGITQPLVLLFSWWFWPVVLANVAFLYWLAKMISRRMESAGME